MQQNDEQVRRHANPTDALQQSKDAMAEQRGRCGADHFGQGGEGRGDVAASVSQTLDDERGVVTAGHRVLTPPRLLPA